MRFLYGISYLIPLLAFSVTVWAAPAGVPAPLDGIAYLTQQLKGAVALIGILMTAIGILLVGVLWFLKQIYDNNKTAHESLREVDLQQWDTINHLVASFGHLSGQHDAAFSLKGCAYEPRRLEEAVEKILLKVMAKSDKKLTPSRQADQPPYTQKGSGALGGAD
jgi:hypothetical protein